MPGATVNIVLDTKTLWGWHMGSSPDFSQPIKSQIRTEYRGVNVPMGKVNVPNLLNARASTQVQSGASEAEGPACPPLPSLLHGVRLDLGLLAVLPSLVTPSPVRSLDRDSTLCRRRSHERISRLTQDCLKLL